MTPNSVRISVINVTAVDAFAGTVDLSATSPAGITVTPNPTSLPFQSSILSLTSTLTVSASASAAPGAYLVIITASAQGAPTESLTLMVVVVANTQLACGSFGTCLIVSDASISNPSYNGGTIHFAATGPSGMSGFANVTIPRTATSDVSDTHVLVNGAILPGNSVAITGNGIDYFIFFNFTFHSPVNVDIELSQLSRSSNFLGVSLILIYAGIAGIAIATIGVVAVLAVRRKKTRSMTTSRSSKPSSGEP